MMLLFTLLLGAHADDACTIDPWIKPGRSTQQVPSRVFAPYVAPQPTKVAAKTSVVFVHISKSAGSTMKLALADAARKSKLRPPITLFRRTWPRFLAACAKGGAACRADIYAGTNAFGACEYILGAARKRGEDRRCVYATVLRNPVERVESSWRYFFLNGAERRKGWTTAMKRSGRCSYSLQRWAQTQSMLSILELGTNQAPVARNAPVNQSARCAPLADGPAPIKQRPRAYLEAALANVIGTAAPVRAIVVEDLANGLRLLAHELNLPLAAAHAWRVENAGAGARADDAARADAKLTLALELELYERVRAGRRAASVGPGALTGASSTSACARTPRGERRPWGNCASELVGRAGAHSFEEK